MPVNLKLDFSTDFERFCSDFNEAVTLRVANVDLRLLSVLSEPHTIKELEPTGAQVTRNGTLFLWSKTRSSRPPIGSIIIDHDSTYWTIYRLTDKQHVETWEAFCLNLNIVTAPANKATLLVAEYSKGDANEAKATWFGLWSGTLGGNATDTVPARFQPASEDSQIEFGADWARESYKIYFDKPLPAELVGGSYRILDQDGNRYRVVQYFNEQRIDRLAIALAVRVTEGSEYHG